MNNEERIIDMLEQLYIKVKGIKYDIGALKQGQERSL